MGKLSEKTLKILALICLDIVEFTILSAFLILLAGQGASYLNNKVTVSTGNLIVKLYIYIVTIIITNVIGVTNFVIVKNFKKNKNIIFLCLNQLFSKKLAILNLALFLIHLVICLYSNTYLIILSQIILIIITTLYIHKTKQIYL